MIFELVKYVYNVTNNLDVKKNNVAIPRKRKRKS